MNSQPEDLDAVRTSTLARELRVLIGALKRRLREQAPPGDLPASQIAVLSRLDREGPKTASALARAENMRPQSMAANMAALEAVGFIQGAPDPSDGRQVIWSLTAKCIEWIEANRVAREDWLFNIMRSKFSPEERTVLARSVDLLKRIAEA